MRWMRQLAGRRRREEELDEEILAHLAIEAKQRVEAGETPEKPEISARRECGNVAFVKDVTRDMWGYSRLGCAPSPVCWMQASRPDIRPRSVGGRCSPFPACLSRAQRTCP
jgi:hypothetical protein